MQDSELLNRERLARIEARLASEGRVVAAQLAEAFDVSVDTIRRDLRELAAEGRCRRVYGGALPPAPRPGTHQQRVAYMPDRKRALAEAAARLVTPGMVVFVDAGTTNLAIVAALKPEMEITLVTNAPAIAAFALDRPAWTLVQIGGVVDIALGAALGASAMRDLALITPDLAFIGVCGFDPVAGATAHSLEEAEFKRQVSARTRCVAVAITDDKLSTEAPYPAFPAEACGIAIFEASAPRETMRSLSTLGVQTLMAGPTGEKESSHE
jgi:DeoR/GlpR family transcriptional regulator of sugar metabolism